MNIITTNRIFIFCLAAQELEKVDITNITFFCFDFYNIYNTKGTQCELIANEFSVTHVSAGELLRLEMAKNSSTGLLIKRCLEEGKIVPVEVTLNLLEISLNTIPYGNFLVDGFPRNMDNYRGWKEVENKFNVRNVFFIECNEHKLIERLTKRGLTSGRSDDNSESIKKRFITFHNETMPIIDIFRKMNKLITISGDDSIEIVYQNIRQYFVSIFTNDVIHATKRHISSLVMESGKGSSSSNNNGNNDNNNITINEEKFIIHEVY